MRRLILHVGTHKTGTTSLQAFLEDNRDRLVAMGYDFPPMAKRQRGVKTGRNGNFLHEYAVEKLYPEGADDERRARNAVNLDAFFAAVREAGTVILSEERLWFEGAQDKRYWEVLRDLFAQAGFDRVDVIAYLRRQDQFIASLWNQKVKDASKLRSTLSQYASAGSSRKAMDYANVLDGLDEVFGRDNVTVRVFERGELAEGDIRHDFCEAVGIPLSDGFRFNADRSNLALTPTMAEIKRQVNHMSEYREMGNYLRVPAESVSSLGSGRGSRLTSEEAKAILAEYAAGNARIARERFNRSDLFNSDVVLRDPEEIEQADLIRDAVRFYAAALSRERMRANELEKRVVALEKRVEGLNSSLGFLSRLRRKWRRRKRRP